MKTILTPFMHPTQDEIALKTSLMLARNFKAHVAALHVPNSGTLWWAAEYDTGITQELLDDAQAALAAEEAEAKSAFENVVADDTVSRLDKFTGEPGPSASWLHAEGTMADIVDQHAPLYDLCVVTRPQMSGDARGALLVESFLTGARRPVVVAPPTMTEALQNADIGNWKILIGWNRTVQSAIATGAALPFLQRAAEVQLLAVTTGTKQGPDAAEMIPHLQAHGVTATVKEVAPDDRTVGQLLLAESGEFGADLLVMGAYSHTRIRELILGGVTRHVLGNAQLPVLMMH